ISVPCNVCPGAVAPENIARSWGCSSYDVPVTLDIDSIEDGRKSVRACRVRTYEISLNDVTAAVVVDVDSRSVQKVMNDEAAHCASVCLQPQSVSWTCQARPG